MIIHVDPGAPDIWKTEPYYSDLKSWSWQAAQNDFQQLVIAIGRRTIAVLPDGDIDLGIVADDEIVLTGRLADGSYAAQKMRADGPSLKRTKFSAQYQPVTPPKL